MSSCQIISEMIPEYINKRTTKKQNADIACHIASCLTCRNDFALWLSIDRSLKRAGQGAPPVDMQAMLNKIPDERTELEKIVNSGSYNMAYKIIRYTFSTVSETYRLAGLFI